MKLYSTVANWNWDYLISVESTVWVLNSGKFYHLLMVGGEWKGNVRDIIIPSCLPSNPSIEAINVFV